MANAALMEDTQWFIKVLVTYVKYSIFLFFFKKALMFLFNSPRMDYDVGFKYYGALMIRDR